MSYRIFNAFAMCALLGTALSPACATAETQSPAFHFKSASDLRPLRHIRFTARDLTTGAPQSMQGVELADGRVVAADSYLAELNRIERELNSYGKTLRSSESNFGIVAVSTAAQPRLFSARSNPHNPNANRSWTHIINHEHAMISSTGSVTQRSQGNGSEQIERNTTHTVSGRFLNSAPTSIAQVTQRVVTADDGHERKELAVFINGVQVFRRGRADQHEARLWETSFDIPVKQVTLPVGPGSIDAKIGVRGQVNLDMELAPDKNSRGLIPDLALNFKPQIEADGYMSAATTPTNVGDAGIEGAIRLCKNTLDVNGTAALTRGFKMQINKLTIDNSFEGFDGKVVGYTNVAIPGKKRDENSNKRFEKEFYSWKGIKVEQRLYEYDSQKPQPE